MTDDVKRRERCGSCSVSLWFDNQWASSCYDQRRPGRMAGPIVHVATPAGRWHHFLLMPRRYDLGARPFDLFCLYLNGPFKSTGLPSEWKDGICGRLMPCDEHYDGLEVDGVAW